MSDDLQLISGVNSGAYLATNQIWDGTLGVSAHWQRIKVADGSEGGTAGVSASWANGLLVDVSRVQGGVSAQLSAGGLLSAWCVPAGQLSAWVLGAATQQVTVSGVPTVSAQVTNFPNPLSAWVLTGTAISADPFHILSANIYNVTAVSGSLSAALFPGGQVSAQLSATSLLSATVFATGLPLSAGGFSLSATSAVLAPSATFRTFVYAVKLVSEASGGWVRWSASGGAVSAIESYQMFDAFGGYTESVTPPGFLFLVSAGAQLILECSSRVSAAEGRVSYWYGV